MNGKNAKKRRQKANKLNGYMNELYELELAEWEATEPRKILFISHFVWKKNKPKAPVDDLKYYQRYIKK